MPESKMMFEMVHDHIATGVTRAVLKGCTAMWKAMEKLSHYYFSWTVSSQKQNNARFFLWKQNNLEVNYAPIRISEWKGGRVFLDETLRKTCYGKD
jgi:hypothetical protein